jgi:hypothetical protein
VLSFYLVFAAVGVELRKAKQAIPAPARPLARSA